MRRWVSVLAAAISMSARSGEGMRADPYMTKVEPIPASSRYNSGFISSSWKRTGRRSSRSRKSES